MIVPNDNRLPPLNGLVLIGGRSQRMGSAKEKMRWHGKEQVYYLFAHTPADAGST